MIVLAREVFLCKCSTEVRDPTPSRGDVGRAPPQAGSVSAAGDEPFDPDLHFVRGDEGHFELLDREHHSEQNIADFRSRLARGEEWVLGLSRGRIATYTWLHVRDRCEYPYLPGCAFELPADFGYGYDAWTPPERRGSGLRRRAFVEELRRLRDRGKAWEASYFVAHQLEGARRSLARAGIEIYPLWRVVLGRERRTTFHKIAEHEGIRPVAGPA